MKGKLFFIPALFISILISSCDKNDIDFENDYEKSHKAWLTFKKSSNNTYNYTVSGSSWVGIAWKTKITVSNGVIKQRDFEYTSFDGFEERILEEDSTWIEYENEINSHKGTPAAEPLTLDEIYKKAKNNWLIKRKDVTTYFEAENEGMISSCGYVVDGCMDDCFLGIHITSIEKTE